MRSGAVGETALGAALPGGIAGSLEWIKRQLARFGKRLGPGDLVLTGSPLPLYRTVAGDVWEAAADGWGRAAALVRDEKSGLTLPAQTH